MGASFAFLRACDLHLQVHQVKGSLQLQVVQKVDMVIVTHQPL